MLRIKEIRKIKGLTINQLAEATGISKRMISAYEANDNDISLAKLQRIAGALNVSIIDLIIDENSVSINYSPRENCDNPSCLKKIDRLEKIIDDLLDDKRRLKEKLHVIQKGSVAH